MAKTINFMKKKERVISDKEKEWTEKLHQAWNGNKIIIQVPTTLGYEVDKKFLKWIDNYHFGKK